MVNEVLDNNFREVMDLGFTARMDEALDEISQGDVEPHEYLKDFFLGGKKGPGLYALVEERKTQIPYPRFEVGTHPETGEPIVVRTGRDGGSFIQLGDQEKKQYANVPDDLAPADLTVEKAVELLGSKSANSEVFGVHPVTGRNLFLKSRNGFYLEMERTPEEIERKEKPTWISLPNDVNPRQLSEEDLALLCTFPREVGVHPQTKAPIVFRIGQYGPYVQSGAEIRNVEDWRKGGTLTVEEAVEILNQPKGRPQRKAAGPLLELGELQGCAGPVRVMPGRFGPYVTDGEVNATIPRGVDPTTLSAEQAQALLAKKRESGPATPRSGRTVGRGTKSATANRTAKASAKSSATKSSTTKKSTAKKAAPKKAAPKKAKG
jgi:DNA topoisomerase-1